MARERYFSRRRPSIVAANHERALDSSSRSMPDLSENAPRRDSCTEKFRMKLSIIRSAGLLVFRSFLNNLNILVLKYELKICFRCLKWPDFRMFFHIIINQEHDLIEGQIFNPQVLRPYSSSKKKER